MIKKIFKERKILKENAQRRALARRMWWYGWTTGALFLAGFLLLDLQREGYPAPTLLEWITATLPFGLAFLIFQARLKMMILNSKNLEVFLKKLNEDAREEN